MEKKDDKLEAAIASESGKFETFYRWIENHMPPSFFEEVGKKSLLMLTHNLMEFDLQGYFSHIHVEGGAFSLCVDSPDADLKILDIHKKAHIRNYRSFVSNAPLPFSAVNAPLRIAAITFIKPSKKPTPPCYLLSKEEKETAFTYLKERNPSVTNEEFEELIQKLNARFLRSFSSERLTTAFDLFFRAKNRDYCQYEIKRQENWEKEDTPSLQIIFAWKGVSKRNFIYRLSKMIHRHGLAIKRVNAINIDPYCKNGILLMSIAVHGIHGKAAWEEADLDDFLKELVTLKFFEGMEKIRDTFTETGLLSGNLCNLLKSTCYFIHQALVQYDLHAYSFEHIEEGLCRHPDITCLFIDAFTCKFHPKSHDFTKYEEKLALAFEKTSHLDTGNEINDIRRKNILNQLGNFIDSCLKTNYYRNNKSALSFRLDPNFIRKMPYDTNYLFPSLPYAVYFIKGFHFLGFHIRFQDLARGGLRTVTPKSQESMLAERNNVFSEAYNLGFTQQKKNKDIPEGGAKAVIFLEPFEAFKEEMTLLEKEYEQAGFEPEEIKEKLRSFLSVQKLEHLHKSQRSFVEALLTLINCNADGTLKVKDVVDYWGNPEYIYLGPDENMHNEMIQWITDYSKLRDYKLGVAFISSKPLLGFNHKELGSTSSGVNVYMEKVLKYLKINPFKDPFTIKLTGGPDGDVAGNQMINLLKFYPKTAKLLTTIDVSGTIFDPEGLDLEEIKKLFLEAKPMGDYPKKKLSPGGFMLDTRIRKETEKGPILTLLSKNVNGALIEEWISTSDTNHLLRNTVHKTKTDVFIPGGGRPRTLHEGNIQEFLDEEGVPTAKAIIEGANLYLTPGARRALEKLGTLIIKDSSSNKGGVICSSFEVLSNLCLTEEEFLAEKTNLVKETLDVIARKAGDEADLLLRTHSETNGFLTEISDEISKEINYYTDAILDLLKDETLSTDLNNPLNQVLLEHCLPTLREKYPERVITEIPDIHKKAILASFLSCRAIYTKGLSLDIPPEDLLKL
jgi:glutamate dehydrogenase